MRSPPFNPVNPANPVNRAKAADALNNAKKQDQALSSGGEVGITFWQGTSTYLEPFN
jgi:hypothetical protein